MATQTPPPKKTPARLAVLSVAIAENTGEIQLFPAGTFRSTDGSGRPEDVHAWQMDAEIAAALIEKFAAKAQRIVIDYEHQTLVAPENGQPAPAAGWIRALQWREGQGLYALVDWTPRASQYIEAGEYRYISPVFPYDKSGRPLDLLHAALTNSPALGGMDEVRLAVASGRFGFAALGGTLSPAPQPEENTMNELLKALFALLGLAEDASEEEALAKLAEFAEKVKTDEDKVAELTEENEKLDEEVAALKAQPAKIDLSKWVPAQAVVELQTQVNALATSQIERDVDEIVTAALTAKKLTPALETWARELGKKDLTALRKFVDQAAPIAALTARQTNGVKPGSAAEALSEAELAVCRAMGLDPNAYAKQGA